MTGIELFDRDHVEWHHTPFTPGTPAFSISSQIIADFTVARAKVKFSGGRDGTARVRIGLLRQYTRLMRTTGRTEASEA